MISKSCPKTSYSVFNLKVTFSKITQKFSKYFNYYCKKNCRQDLSKIAKSDHTDHKGHYIQDGKDSNKFLALDQSFSSKQSCTFRITTKRAEKWRQNSKFCANIVLL